MLIRAPWAKMWLGAAVEATLAAQAQKLAVCVCGLLHRIGNTQAKRRENRTTAANSNQTWAQEMEKDSERSRGSAASNSAKNWRFWAQGRPKAEQMWRQLCQSPQLGRCADPPALGVINAACCPACPICRAEGSGSSRHALGGSRLPSLLPTSEVHLNARTATTCWRRLTSFRMWA